RGLAQIGLRDFDGAQAALRTAYRLAEEAHDVHAQLNATALMARIPLAQRMPSRALDILETTASRAAGPGMEGELRSMRALAFACMGQLGDAEREIQASASITSHLEARGLRTYASVIVAHVRGEAKECLESLRDAVRE